MATLDTLLTVYRSVHRLPAATAVPPSALAQLTVMAQSVEAVREGGVGFGWSYPSAVAWIQDSARATTQVAALSYAFLLDVTVGGAGLDYLVSESGPNPNSLSSAYYGRFNLENRFINFAVNLAKVGEGRETFLATYGETSIHQTFRAAYLRLFGSEKPLSDIVDLLSDLVPDGRGGAYTRGEYFVELGGDGGNGVGTRAAMIGWLMAEAVKSGQGPYVQALSAYLADLAADGEVTPASVFMSLYGPGGDQALGGPAAAGLPGENARYASDWDVDVAKPDVGSGVRPLATHGNDLLRPLIADDGGLQPGRRLAAGDGNDTIQADNGPMRGHIDGGAGNDVILVDRLEGRITTGAGYDTVDLGGFGPLTLVMGEPADLAVVADFQRGRDLIQLPAILGSGTKRVFSEGAESLGEVLELCAGLTPAGTNSVFEWQGDTYIYHADGVVGLGSGDGLVRLAGVTGLAVANAGQAGDLVFGA